MAAGVVVIGGLRSSSELVGPIVLALVVTVAVHPMRSRLERRLPRWASTAVMVVAVNVVMVGLAVALVAAVARFGTLATSYHDDFSRLVQDVTAWMHHLGLSGRQTTTVDRGLDLSRLAEIVTAALSGFFGALSSLLFIVALIFFMTIDGGTIPVRLADAALVRPRFIAGLLDFAHSTRRYLLVSTAFGFAVAVFDTLALIVIGVPAPLVWGLLAFLTNYIPNIGFVIGLVPPAVLALLDGGVGEMLVVILVYCLLNLVIQSVIQPRVVGGAVGLSTTLTFLSLVFWSWVLGPLGAILAVPMSLLVKATLVDADPDNDWLRPLVANRDEAQR